MEGFKKKTRKWDAKFKKMISWLLIVPMFFSMFDYYYPNNSYASMSTLIAADLELGDIVVLGKLGGVPLKWRVCGFGKNCESKTDCPGGAPYLVLDNWTDEGLNGYSDMGFDLRHSGDISLINDCGSDNWEKSTIRIWLNSDLKNGSINYDHKFYTGQNAYPGKNGFLNEFTEAEKNSILSITHKNVVSNRDTYDGGNAFHEYNSSSVDSAYGNYDRNAYYRETTDKVFLLNLKELKNAISNSGDSNFVYYSSNYTYRMRDHWKAQENRTLGLNVYGEITSWDAWYTNNKMRLRPALQISPSQYLAKTQSNNYEIYTPSVNDVTISGVSDKTYNGLSQIQNDCVLTFSGDTLTETTNVTMKKASDLQLGNIIVLGKLGGVPLKWRVCGFGQNCETKTDCPNGAPYLVLDNWMDAGLNGYNGMCFDQPHTGDNTDFRNSYGSSAWKTSTLKTWLNSDLANGSINYDHKYYTGQNAYPGKNGFLNEFSSAEKRALLSVTHKNVAYSMDRDGGASTHTSYQYNNPASALQNYGDAYYQEVTDKVFLMNIKELNNAVLNASVSGFVYSNSSARYWLRDTEGNTTFQSRCVDTDNRVFYKSCKESDSNFRIRAAILIAPTQKFVETSSGEYKLGGNYYVTYSSDTVNSGTVTMTFNGIGDYIGTQTKTYDINKKPVSIDVSSYSGVAKEYDGTTNVSFSGSNTLSQTANGMNGEVLNFKLAGTYADVDAGINKTVTYSISSFESVTGGQGNKNNYTLTVDTSHNTTSNNTITSKVINVDLSEEVASKLYDGDNKVKWAGSESKNKTISGVNSETINYSISGTYDNANIGTGKTATYTINSGTTVSGGREKTSNYSLQIESGKNANKSSEIKDSEIHDNDFEIDLSSVEYTGSEIEKTITTGLNPSEYDVEYSNNINIGTATITITGKGSHHGTVSKQFTITPKVINVDLSDLSAVSKEYDGTTSTPDRQLTCDGVVGEILHFTVSGNYDSKSASTGNKKVTYTLKSFDSVIGGEENNNNYTLSVDAEKNFTSNNTINTKNISLSGVSVSNKPYDGNTNAIVSFTSSSDIVSGDDVTISLSGTFDTKDCGTGKAVTILPVVSGEDKDNYFVESPTGFSANIEPKDLHIDATTDDGDYNTGAVISVTFNLRSEEIVPGDNLGLSTTSGTGIVEATGVGRERNVTVSSWPDLTGSTTEMNNYTVVHSNCVVNLTCVDLTNETLEISLVCATKYDGTPKTVDSTVKWTAEGITLVEGTDYTIDYLDDHTSVGTHNVMINFIGNYKGSKTSNFEILRQSSGGGGGSSGGGSSIKPSVTPGKNIKDEKEQKITKEILDKISIKDQKIISLPNADDIKREGFTFGGFFYDEEFTKPVKVGDKITVETEIFIKWIKNESNEQKVEAKGLTVQTNKPYIKGYDDGEFKPNRFVTRAEFATVISGIFMEFDEKNLDFYIEKDKEYKDVRTDFWYTPYIGFVISNNIMLGYSDKSFKPNENITRAEVCKSLVNIFEFENKNVDNKFKNELKGKWYEEAVTTLVEAGLIYGYNDGTFRGNNNITRTELVVLINRLIGKTISDEEANKLEVSFKDVNKTNWYYKDVLIASR